MSKQKRIRSKGVVGIAAIAMITIAVFSPRTSAHNINLDKAWEVARDFARATRNEKAYGYLHYKTDCRIAFPGHNHIVKCMIEYQNAKDTKAGVYTCTEAIEVYFHAHGRSDTHNYSYKIRHTSGNSCGSRQPGVEYR